MKGIIFSWVKILMLSFFISNVFNFGKFRYCYSLKYFLFIMSLNFKFSILDNFLLFNIYLKIASAEISLFIGLLKKLIKEFLTNFCVTFSRFSVSTKQLKNQLAEICAVLSLIYYLRIFSVYPHNFSLCLNFCIFSEYLCIYISISLMSL